jgi:hypothetical protein
MVLVALTTSANFCQKPELMKWPKIIMTFEWREPYGATAANDLLAGIGG